MTFETIVYLIHALTISCTISPANGTALRLYPYFNTAALVKRFFKLYERCEGGGGGGNDEPKWKLWKLSPQQI